MAYRFLENITTADSAFEATGETPEELFISAAKALEETQVRTKNLKLRAEKKIELENNTLDKLLFDFLNELIFYKDAEGLAFSKFEIEIKTLSPSRYTLVANLGGEKLDPSKHELRTDVKAVTKHRFEVQKTREGYKATVVLDI